MNLLETERNFDFNDDFKTHVTDNSMFDPYQVSKSLIEQGEDEKEEEMKQGEIENLLGIW